MKPLRIVLAILSLAIALPLPVDAQIARTERVAFASGESGADIPGRITGYEQVGYLLDARAGQRMVVAMTADNASANFNIFAPGDEPGEAPALFSGSIEGRTADLTLTEDGDYLVQVFLERAAARRDEQADYDLSFGIVAP